LGSASRTGTARTPVVLNRGRITLVDAQARWFKQPYHAAAGMNPKDAQEFLQRCATRARLLARRALRGIAASVTPQGYCLQDCGIVLGFGRPLPALAAILRSHPMLHTAEGVFFREVLARVARNCKFPVTGVSERELFARGASDLGLPAHKLRRHLAGMGKPLGPPWRQDEKYSALVAWLALRSVTPASSLP
jgi:hypothetical protein